MTFEEIVQYLNAKKIDFDDSVLENLKKLKSQSINELNENLSNEIWCLEEIYKIQKMYVTMFKKLNNSEFFDSWRILEQIDIHLSFLRENYDYSGNKFNMEFIQKTIRYYEKLFPYQYFMSRESIVKKEKCSICNKVNTIRNRCEHKVGKLYMGEMCSRIVLECEWIGTAIVKNPFDKYTVLFPKGMEYNYYMLEHLMPNLNSPYDRWYVEVLIEKNRIYKGVGRNDKCPCGSEKKYKKCCRGTDRELTDHHRITLLDNPNVKPVPFEIINTWKK